MRDKIKTFYNNFEGVLAGVCLAALTVIIVVEVIRRYIFGAPGAYSEEIARYLFIYCTFFSMGYAVKHNSHIVTDILPESLPPKLNLTINLIVMVIFFCFSLFMIGLGMAYVDRMVMFERMTEAMAVPMYYFCIAPPLGFAVTAIRCAERGWHIIRELCGTSAVKV